MAWINTADIASYLGNYVNHFAIFGAAVVAYTAAKIGKRILSISLRAVRRSFAVDLKEYGRWAVITGCTDGLGKSYAFQLAEKGLDVVLISRNPQKLSAVAEEIGQRYKVEVKVITADFKKTDIYENIRQELNGLDIGILVNNVGMMHPMTPDYHCELDDFEQYSMDIISVNVTSYVMMTNIVLPDMLERKRGTIINISSAAGLRPTPLYSLYAATKAFERFFSEALNLEYSARGVTVQVVTPNVVMSNMIRHLATASLFRQGLLVPSADDFVRKAIQTIGRESVTSAYWPHEILNFLYRTISDSSLTTTLLRQRSQMIKFLKKE